MLQKKICMLGAFAVGKTSLVRRYVHSLYSDTYLTTVGVKIDKKAVVVDGRAIDLILWDVAGEDPVSAIRMSYLRGAAGYFLVVDGTRPSTLDVARSIQSRVEGEFGPLPFVTLLNKYDLKSQWALSGHYLEELEQAGWGFHPTSAMSGEGVEEGFRELAARIVG